MLNNKFWKSKNYEYVLMALPLLITLALMIYYPLVSVFLTSFTDLDLGDPGTGRFIGLTNFGNLFRDARLVKDIEITIYTIVGPVIIQLLVGFILALCLYRQLWITAAGRVFLLIPMFLTPIVVGLIWRMLLMPRIGGLNYLLSLVGIKGPHWLGRPFTALMAIIMTTSWQWTPFVMIYLLSGLQSLPLEPYEAARIDGASGWQMLIYVTIPLLKPVIILTMLLRIIESLKIFPLIYIMTSGGPGSATETIYFYAYKMGFQYLQIGYSSSITLIMYILTAIGCWFLVRVQYRAQEVL
jgi:multiple sugar transport system permease protein